MPKVNIQNKWTTWTGIIMAVGTAITCIAMGMAGDLSAIDCLKESWMGIVGGIGLIKASDGTL